MATLEALIQDLTKFEIALKAAMPNISRKMAQTVLSYTLASIRRNGIPGNKRYSNGRGVPAYLYRTKSGDYPRALNGAGRSFIDRKIREAQQAKKKKFAGFVPFGSSNAGFINWKQLRQAQGLQVSEVDVTYSGRMLQNVGTTSIKISGGKYITLIEGFDTETKQKLIWNFKRYGKFLTPPAKALEFGKAEGLREIKEIFVRNVKTT